MKTLSKVLIGLLCITLMAGCEKEDSKGPVKPEMDPKQVFTAEFIVWDYSESSSFTNSPLTWRGNGASELIGPFEVEITLLCNKFTGEFCNLEGILVAEDGSKLFFMIPSGKICPNTGIGCEYYQKCFNDQAEIVGGTGRCAFASGNFYPNVFIHDGFDSEDDKWFAKFSCQGRIFTVIESDEQDRSDRGNPLVKF